jgi:hypothetical protein
MAIQDFTAGQILTAAQMDSLQANDYNWTVSTKTASYVLVAADKGTRVVMNAAGATTITVNTSLFSAGDTLFIQNIGAGTCTITAGTATVTTAGSLALGTWAGGTLYFTSASAAIFFSGGAPTWGRATGGIGSPTAVTISGVNYEYLTFTSTGTLTVTRSGFFDYLAVGGGTGGVGFSSNSSGGGGSGVLLIGSIYLDANQTITIGAGGSGAEYTTVHTAGNTSIAATSPFTVTASGGITSTGGGQVDAYKSSAFVGGGPGAIGAQTITAITSPYGKQGGNAGGDNAAGGGGGYSGAGGAGSGTTGGAAGNGFDISVFIGGSAAYKAAGGGGGGSVTGGSAGSNGGTAGGTTTTGNNAAANSGSGAGGGKGTLSGQNGGSGICYIRWKV